jgi:hypothetical protein
LDLNILNNTARKILFNPINIGGFKIIPSMVEMEEISLINSADPDLSYWSRVKKVTYRPNGDIFNKTFDLAPLQNIEKGVFQLRNCINYHRLSNLKSLEISNNNSITDVSCFQTIPILCLRDCTGITDVSPLWKVQKLDLTLCKNIRDVSALARVHTWI